MMKKTGKLLCAMALCGASGMAGAAPLSDDFVLIKGGTFNMGSPQSEAWRGADETLHEVTVSDFYLSKFEVTQELYESVMGTNPSHFKGPRLPVESLTWLEAVEFCNALSQRDGRTPAYIIEDGTITWNKGADGYRLPTEAEWEYACRAGSSEPFNIPVSPGEDTANFYAHYPYGIEENYFSQQNLKVKPGYYRQTTVEVGSFEPNALGLYDMHGNVGEWVFDLYGPYEQGAQTDPDGASTGIQRVYRGGGWNDFAKNLRSAYRAALDQDKSGFSIGLRLAVSAQTAQGTTVSTVTAVQAGAASSSKILVAYFSWSGNTRGIAEEIARITDADLFEITLVQPYSDDYSEVLRQAQRDQRNQARPEIAGTVQNFEQYDTVMVGYPNWWASIPMPIASFLESYDFAGKKVIPFCSHGGGRLGQSISAIVKIVPDAVLGEPLSVHYSGGSSLFENIQAWLQKNEIMVKAR